MWMNGSSRRGPDPHMRLSTNIESTEDISWAREWYYPTNQAKEFIGELSRKSLDGGAALALEGPYGAGKSSLLAFLLNQVASSAGDCPSMFASGPFQGEDCPTSRLREVGGLVPLAFTGSMDSLASKILSVAEDFAERNPHEPGVSALRDALSKSDGKSAQALAVESLRTFARAIRASGGAGALLVVDEFGRHLEQMLGATGNADLHLLQEIAESTGNPDAPLTLVIVQHQGLDQYTDRLLGDARAEWEKVRGRFREMVLQNSEADTARIIANTFRSLPRVRSGQLPDPVTPHSGKSAPVLMRDTEFLDACASCRPLHPMTIALLARLSRLLGQQDRTVVGWLSSERPTGFAAARNSARGGWVGPSALFDHFFADALKTPSNPVFAKRFAAIFGAWERIGDDLEADARLLFKVMALLSFCSGRGISADRGGALACLPARFPFKASIERLISRSLLVHREFRSEYVVWEGSDYDVVGKVEAEMSFVELDAASEMNQRFARDVLAHRHYIETGNRRTARLIWLNPSQPAPAPSNGPRILAGLGAPPDSAACADVDVRASIPCAALTPHLKASAAIRRLLESDADLKGDKVATKEMHIRLEHHDGAISAVIEEWLASKTKWWLGSMEFTSMQEAVTAAMCKAYPMAFELHLDMFNRNLLSGQASAAFRKLIEAMCESPSVERLGIERFPAERILYEAFIKQSRLHVKGRDGTWRLTTTGSSMPEGLRRTLAKVREQFAVEGGAKSVEDAVCAVSEMPFGVKRSPALLLCAVILLVERDRYELYESGSYLPDWGPQTLVRMVKAPKRFSISATTDAPVDKLFMAKYRQALSGEGQLSEHVTTVAVARAALKRHAKLSNYARSTQTVSETACALRRAVRVAKSPSDMLFRTIPSALGHNRLPLSGSGAEEYLSCVEDARVSLERADESLLCALADIVVEAWGAGPISEARRECVGCVESVLEHSRVHHGYVDFVDAVLGNADLDDLAWLARVADTGLGIREPLDSWSDAHVAQAEFALRRILMAVQEAGRMLKDAEAPIAAKPFLVFLPSSGTMDATPQERELEAILSSAPKSQRMAIIASLALTFRDTA